MGIVPFAGVGQQALDAADVLDHGTPEARRGLAIGQIFGGLASVLGGVTGKVLGGIASATGIGAAIGVPAIAVSATLVLGGMGNIAAGYRGLMTTGSGSSSPQATTPAEAARPGKAFRPQDKQQVIDANQQKNGGVSRCENCAVETVPGQKSQKGVSPPRNETQIDHINARSKGGSGTPDNGQVLCRGCNREKWNK